MPRRVVWYLAGSPVAPLLQGLPARLEALPVPAGQMPSGHPEDSAVLLVDLRSDDWSAVASVTSRMPGVPVVALLDPRERVPPAVSCYAYLPAAVAPFILAATLDNA